MMKRINVIIAAGFMLLGVLNSKAQGVFMKIENPAIEGDVESPISHDNEIYVYNFEYDIDNNANIFSVASGGISRSNASFISVEIPSSKASAKIYQAVTQGTLYQKVTIIAQRNTTSGYQDYATYEFGKVIFSSVSAGKKYNENNTVKVVFKAGEYNLKFRPYLPGIGGNLGALGPEIEFGWSFITNSQL